MAKRLDVKRLVILAMFTALSFVVVCLIRIPAVAFLKYEPKDVIITVGGFILGPLASLIISFVVALLEMVTISETGIIGAVMNFLSSCCFACIASLVYKYRRTLSGAILGLLLGSVVTVGVMILWNWLITPLYMGVSREQVVGMLVPIFLPFNAVKVGLKTALTVCLYKPLVSALRKTRLLPTTQTQKGSPKIGIYLFAGALLITCIVFLLVLRGIL